MREQGEGIPEKKVIQDSALQCRIEGMIPSLSLLTPEQCDLTESLIASRFEGEEEGEDSLLSSSRTPVPSAL